MSFNFNVVTNPTHGNRRAIVALTNVTSTGTVQKLTNGKMDKEPLKKGSTKNAKGDR